MRRNIFYRWWSYWWVGGVEVDVDGRVDEEITFAFIKTKNFQFDNTNSSGSLRNEGRWWRFLGWVKLIVMEVCGCRTTVCWKAEVGCGWFNGWFDGDSWIYCSMISDGGATARVGRSVASCNHWSLSWRIWHQQWWAIIGIDINIGIGIVFLCGISITREVVSTWWRV